MRGKATPMLNASKIPHTSKVIPSVDDSKPRNAMHAFFQWYISRYPIRSDPVQFTYPLPFPAPEEKRPPNKTLK
jgi:hypothetical protein